MLESKRLKDQTEIEVRFVRPAEVPATDRHIRARGPEHRPAGDAAASGAPPARAGNHSFRYLAAGDYWFDRDAAADRPESHSRVLP
ncbi:hypothetical protein [Streptomyces sp. NPDC093514]|uniref:hypothetical protein n=1 Tax=Streptomyces sp. NPDC093514 TaxID=3366039 RepID=UPI00381DDB2C